MLTCTNIKICNRKLAEHKDTAQAALEYYCFTVEKCKQDWKAIIALSSGEELNEVSRKELESLQKSFVLVISVDYQMIKLIPHWGTSDQPGISYYLRKVSHDVFGIVDHGDETKYVAIFNKQIGPKNSDHTVSILLHYIHYSGLVPYWVRRVCIF